MVDLNINIKSLFEKAGFKEADQQMQALEKQADSLGLSTREVSNRMEALDVSLDEAGGTVGRTAGVFRDSEGQYASISDETAALEAVAHEMGESMEFVEAQLERTNLQLMENEEGVKQFRDTTTGTFLETEEVINSVQQQLQTFRFDMLSLMFAGQELSSAMSGLISPAMESAGVFDLISDVLTVFFMPAAMMVMDWVQRIAGFLFDLPEPVRSAINVFAVLAVVIGAVTKALTIAVLNFKPLITIISKASTFIGKKGLIGALKALGKFIVGPFLKAGAALVGILGAPITIIAAVVGAIVGLALAWKNNWFDIRQRTGKAVKWIGRRYQDLIDLSEPVTDSIDWIAKQLSRLPGIDIEDGPLARSQEAIQQKIMDIGDAAIESGEKLEEMDEKTPDEAEDAFMGRRMPDVGDPSQTEPMGGQAGNGMQFNDLTTNVNVDAGGASDEEEIADLTAERNEEVLNNMVRGV